MKIHLFILFLLFPLTQSFCQIPQRSSGQVVTGSNMSIFNDPNLSALSFESKSDVIKYENIDGSPYVNNSIGANNIVPIGKFYSPQLEYMETALARYNAYTDNMEVSLLEDGVDYYLLQKKPEFLYIVLGEKTYRAYDYFNTFGFYVILSKDDREKCVLLKKEKVEFNKEVKAESTFVTGTPDSFKRLKDVYYLKLDEKLVEIPKKKKQIYSLFKEKAADIKDYIQKNRLKTTDEDDLLKIVTYYNSLFR